MFNIIILSKADSIMEKTPERQASMDFYLSQFEQIKSYEPLYMELKVRTNEDTVVGYYVHVVEVKPNVLITADKILLVVEDWDPALELPHNLPDVMSILEVVEVVAGGLGLEVDWNNIKGETVRCKPSKVVMGSCPILTSNKPIYNSTVH